MPTRISPRSASPLHAAPPRADNDHHAGDLYGELFLDDTAPRRARLRAYLPGLAVCTVAAAAAAWLSEHYGAPLILMGLLLGLALNFVAIEPRTHAGLDLASRGCLRVGIAILGTQVTLAQVTALGAAPFAALLGVMALATAAGIAGAKAARQPFAAGLLAGGATAICGASAALALYGVIGRERLPQAQFAVTLVGVSLASAIAMSLYPPIATSLGLDDRQAGFLIGASIHDVAQAIGGGYAVSDLAGGYATIVKLARVALLAPLVALAALLLGGGKDSATPVWRRIALPWFIVTFLALLLLNSAVTLPAALVANGLVLSKTLLLLAVTATAMRSQLGLLMQVGWRGVVPVLAATLASFVAALAASTLLLG